MSARAAAIGERDDPDRRDDDNGLLKVGPFERFIGAVTAAITAATGPAATPPGNAAATPPAVIAPAMPDTIPLPRPRPAPDTPAEPLPAIAAAPDPLVPAVAGTPLAAAPAAAGNPFVAPAGATGPPPALGFVGTAPAADAAGNVVVPGVTILAVRPNAGTAGPVDPVPLNLPDMLATLGQPTVATAPGAVAPLGFAATDIPPDGPFGAIDALLRGGVDGQPGGALLAGTAPLPRANPLPEAERIRVAALPGVAAFVPAPAAARQQDNACLAQLASLVLVATVLPPVDDGTCGIATPVDVAQLGAGRNAVTLAPDATVDCSVVGALDAWMNQDVQDAATRLFGQRVTSLRVGSSYACRGRNNDPTAPLSEHAFGRAIDISAFQFADGTWLEVHAAAANTPEAAFLGEVRTGACGPFRTVLGPGVAYYGDHLHLDLAVRGQNGDALYCR